MYNNYIVYVIHKKDLQGKNRMTFAIEGDFDEVQ